MLYALIITTMMQSYNSPRPVAVSKTVIEGFSTRQACENAGGADSAHTTGRWDNVTYKTTFVCVSKDV